METNDFNNDDGATKLEDFEEIKNIVWLVIRKIYDTSLRNFGHDSMFPSG